MTVIVMERRLHSRNNKNLGAGLARVSPFGCKSIKHCFLTVVHLMHNLWLSILLQKSKNTLARTETAIVSIRDLHHHESHRFLIKRI